MQPDFGKLRLPQPLMRALCASTDMTSKKVELEEALEELISILEKHGERHWSKMLRKSLQRIETGDYSGVELLKTFYGGMGSFNDLLIQPNTTKGKIEFTEKQIGANRKIDLLRETAWTLAGEIKYEN
jgi:hypothetical protein